MSNVAKIEKGKFAEATVKAIEKLNQNPGHFEFKYEWKGEGENEILEVSARNNDDFLQLGFAVAKYFQQS